MVAEYWNRIQGSLLQYCEKHLEVRLTKKLEQFILILEVVRIEKFVRTPYDQWMGRKELDRRPIARAFIAKCFFQFHTNELLIEALKMQPGLRELCGFESIYRIPSASTFSRAFAQFARDGLGDRVHKYLTETHIGGQIVMHISRDSTAVSAREKPAHKIKTAPMPKHKRGRPKKDEQRSAKELTRIQKQLDQTPEQALEELGYACNVGSKKDSKGNSHYWIGWKVHIDWADSIPVFVVTTSASVHDSQLAIPMARITARRVNACYQLMDSAYDAAPIHQACRELGHVPIIDPNRRRGDAAKMDPDRIRRYKERANAERGNSRLKDEFGFRTLRVRGHAKAHMHLMFGILTLFADQLLKIHRC